jgi:hypothetical protein
MKILVNNNKVVVYIGEDTGTINATTNMINFSGISYSLFNLTVCTVEDIPQGVVPNQYCYDPTNGFTPNPNYVSVINGVPQALNVVQATQEQLITNAYTNALTQGFTSSASGTVTQYPYTSTAELTFDELYLELMSNKITYPCSVYDVNSNVIQYANATQLTQLFTDIASFKATQNSKMHGYLSQIDACTDAASVQAIVWS